MLTGPDNGERIGLDIVLGELITAMYGLSRPVPPFGPPSSEEERLSRLRNVVRVADRNAMNRASEQLIFSGLLTAFAWGLEFTAFVVVDQFRTVAVWSCVLGIVLWLVNLSWMPAWKARDNADGT